ncbi:L,D-transpeptidase family protein [Allorhizobium undicola]|uniref:L,D-transpeptidase n=1 Tax=Allorhizobium undicola TaxID=78527 RepID=UPI000483A755|nr:L,D-transpeptidase [Allorhizobium undicola]
MLSRTFFHAFAAAIMCLPAAALADDRYQARPPVIVSPDLASPWLMQLGVQPDRRVQPQPGRVAAPVYAPPVAPRRVAVAPARPAGLAPEAMQLRPAVQQVAMQPVRKQMTPTDPQFLPQVVEYQTKEKPGTLVIDTNSRFLYLVMEGGKARRYGVGVGKPGFEWAGEHKVTRKSEWPEWIPPQEMIEREAAKGHYLPARMQGGPENPLGARALYLGSTLYRIHGTNAPWTIGYGVSSGCIRMRNEDVTDLYERVPVGTRVIVM